MERVLTHSAKRCGRCLSLDTRKSRRRSGLEYLLGLFAINPYRCRACGKRFLRFL
ncbi:MAG: hypothetical protein WCD18_09335 [Thermosynechococcaceae cyanobacterium]